MRVARALVLACPFVLLAWQVVQTAWYLPVWRSDLTLWAHAVEMAPDKPRPRTNYGAQLLKAGRIDAGIAQWQRAAILAQQPHVPSWDRARTQQTLATNVRAILGVAP